MPAGEPRVGQHQQRRLVGASLDGHPLGLVAHDACAAGRRRGALGQTDRRGDDGGATRVKARRGDRAQLIGGNVLCADQEGARDRGRVGIDAGVRALVGQRERERHVARRLHHVGHRQQPQRPQRRRARRGLRAGEREPERVRLVHRPPPQRVVVLLRRVVVAAAVPQAVAHGHVRGQRRDDALPRGDEAPIGVALQERHRPGHGRLGVLQRDRRVLTDPGSSQVGERQRHGQGDRRLRARGDQRHGQGGERQPDEQRHQPQVVAVGRGEAPGGVQCATQRQGRVLGQHDQHGQHGDRAGDGQRAPAGQAGQVVEPPAGQQRHGQQRHDRQPCVVRLMEPRQRLDDAEQRLLADDHQQRDRAGGGDPQPLLARPQQREAGQHQRQRPRVERPRDDERVAHHLRRPPPVVGQRQREQVAPGRARGVVSGSLGDVGRVGQQLQERQQEGRRQSGAGQEPAGEAPERLEAMLGRQAQQREQHGHGQHVEARLRVPAGELQRDDQRQRGHRPPPCRSGILRCGRVPRRRSSHHPVGGQQHPRQPGPHTRQRPGQPDDVEQAKPRHHAGEQRAAQAQAQRPGQQERPERHHPQLQRGDQPQRPPEGQHVRRPRERREDRRLHVGEQRPPALDVRVPQRHVRQPVARVGLKRLELRDGVGHLVVGAQVAHARRAVRRPRRDRPQQVGGGQRPPGQQALADEGQREDRVQHGGRHTGAAAHRGGDPAQTGPWSARGG